MENNIVVQLNDKNTKILESLMNQKQLADESLNEFIRIILDAKEIDYTNAKTYIKDFKIIVEQIN